MKPYIRLLNHPVTTTSSGIFAKFKVWLVDGPWVRAQGNEQNQFTNFGQHFRFPFIPMFEFWIDFFEANRSEQGYFILHMMSEWQDMKDGKSYEAAYDHADEVEKRARAKYEHIDENVDPLDAKIRMFHELQDGMTLWLADEEFIHAQLTLNYAEGGHHLVPGYEFIPADEYWIGQTLPVSFPLPERLIISGHEIGEHTDMKKNGTSYPKAHAKIAKKELEVRENPDGLMPWLQSLGW